VFEGHAVLHLRGGRGKGPQLIREEQCHEGEKKGRVGETRHERRSSAIIAKVDSLPLERGEARNDWGGGRE